MVASNFHSVIRNVLFIAIAITAILSFTGYVTAATTAMVAGDGELQGEDYAGPMGSVTSDKYTHCRPGCPDTLFVCKDWCVKEGYNKGGECVPPLHNQCCCFGPLSA
ncbi:hypothetical protein ACP70R_008527 [Stipagrostis hirtigluma subsp. patula]